MQVARVERHEDPSADNLYFLVCPAPCLYRLNIETTGLSSLNKLDIVDALTEHMPEFRVVDLVIDDSCIRVFRI